MAAVNNKENSWTRYQRESRGDSSGDQIQPSLIPLQPSQTGKQARLVNGKVVWENASSSNFTQAWRDTASWNADHVAQKAEEWEPTNWGTEPEPQPEPVPEVTETPRYPWHDPINMTNPEDGGRPANITASGRRLVSEYDDPKPVNDSESIDRFWDEVDQDESSPFSRNGFGTPDWYDSRNAETELHPRELLDTEFAGNRWQSRSQANLRPGRDGHNRPSIPVRQILFVALVILLVVILLFALGIL